MAEHRQWRVVTWRYRSRDEEPFDSEARAIEWAKIMADSDECWVEGILSPDDVLDTTFGQFPVAS